MASSSPTVPTTRRPRKPIVLLAGGDVEFGRMRGDRLVRDPSRDDFRPFSRWFAGADLRFANLESTISEHFAASREHPRPLVFTAPTLAADVLRRAGIDIVSLANNHAWDFGEDGLTQTLTQLDRVGVAHAGAGPDGRSATAATVLERGGFRFAFIAVTSAWNQLWSPHPGKERIADAADNALVTAIREAREHGADRVIVSHHGGDETIDEPTVRQRHIARIAVEHGADLVIGHHAHVIQRVVRHAGKPIAYGLGNFLMRMVTAKPWTEWGMALRATFAEDGTSLEVCPFRTVGLDPLPLWADSRRAAVSHTFRQSFERLLRGAAIRDGESQLALGQFDAAGCAPLIEK